MRVAVIGSRGYPRLDLVESVVRELWAIYPNLVIVSGGAKGVDQHAADVARGLGVPVDEIKADWDRHGTSAGMIRNGAIIASADEVHAFWDGGSPGTKNGIDRARKACKRLLVYNSAGALRREESLF